MALQPNKVHYDFPNIELFSVVSTKQFSKVRQFLEAHGGLDGVDEYGRTALMGLALRRCMHFPGGDSSKDFETVFAKKLVELGCDINKKDRRGFTALRFAVEDKNIELVRFLLSRDGIETASTPLPLDDEMVELFVRARCDVFNRKLGTLEGNFQNCLALHQGKSWFGVGDDYWMDFSRTLGAVCELYPERLKEVPPFYLDTVQYDFLLHDFLAPGSGHLNGKKAITAYVRSLPRGVESTDEMGRNLLSCCAKHYQFMKNIPKEAVERRRAERCARYLADMGVSPVQPDFSGKTPVAYLREAGLEEIVDYLSEKYSAELR